MNPWWWPAFGFVAAHAALVTALHWPAKWPAPVSVACWVVALLASLEPSRTKSPRHRDVAAAERTPLGEILLHREGWSVKSAPLALALLVVLSLGAGLAALALAGLPIRPPLLFRVLAWSPAVLLAAGWLMQSMVNMWIVIGPILGFSLLFTVLAAAAGDTRAALRIGSIVPGLALAVFCTDLLRSVRRAAARSAEPPTAAGGAPGQGP